MKQSNEWLKCFHENQQGLYFEHTLLTVERSCPAHYMFTDMVNVKKKKNTYIHTDRSSNPRQHFGAERIPLVSLHRVKYTI